MVKVEGRPMWNEWDHVTLLHKLQNAKCSTGCWFQPWTLQAWHFWFQTDELSFSLIPFKVFSRNYTHFCTNNTNYIMIHFKCFFVTFVGVVSDDILQVNW